MRPLLRLWWPGWTLAPRLTVVALLGVSMLHSDGMLVLLLVLVLLLLLLPMLGSGLLLGVHLGGMLLCHCTLRVHGHHLRGASWLLRVLMDMGDLLSHVLG